MVFSPLHKITNTSSWTWEGITPTHLQMPIYFAFRASIFKQLFYSHVLQCCILQMQQLRVIIPTILKIWAKIIIHRLLFLILTKAQKRSAEYLTHSRMHSVYGQGKSLYCYNFSSLDKLTNLSFTTSRNKSISIRIRQLWTLESLFLIFWNSYTITK